MNKNIKNIIVAAGVGYGAWYLYKKFKSGGFAKVPNNKTEAEITKEVNEAIAASTTPVDGFKTKVMKLQALLNVAVDGAFGPISTAALQKLYNGTLPYGSVSTSNVTKYIEDIELKKTPAQMQASTALVDKLSKDASTRVKQIIAANGVMVLAYAYSANELVLDKATGRWVATGIKKTFAKGQRLTGWTKQARQTTLLLGPYAGATGKYEFPANAILVV